jgi:hypothetical protein
MTSTRTYWFGRKRFGWGIGPKSWQGWMAILVYCLLMIGSSAALRHGPHQTWDIAIKIIITGAFFTLMGLTYDRTKH